MGRLSGGLREPEGWRSWGQREVTRERVTAFGAMTSHPQASKNDTPPPSIPQLHRSFSFRPTGKEKTRQCTVQQQTDAVFEKIFSQFPFCCSRTVLQLPFPAGTEEYTQAVYFFKIFTSLKIKIGISQFLPIKQVMCVSKLGHFLLSL